jgi:hypothetical protein
MLTVSAVAKSGIAVTLAQDLDLGKVEVLPGREENQRDLGDGRRSHKFVLQVSAYETGDLEVPAIPLKYVTPKGEAKPITTQPLTLHVKPLIAPEEQKLEVQPPRPPRSAWVEDKRVIAALKWGGIGLGGLIALYIVWRILKRLFWRPATRQEIAAREASGPIRPPEEVAMEKLRALRAAGNFAKEEYRLFYFAVAEVVRAYLGARYGFDSLELTTQELLEELSRRAPHLTEPSGEVVRFLSDTDLVKFAKTGSTDLAALAVLDAAQAIVLSTAKPLEEVVKAISGPVRLPREDLRGD